jgi:hypothetical protein
LNRHFRIRLDTLSAKSAFGPSRHISVPLEFVR